MESFDCIVLGLGGVGSAAAYELARRDVRVLGLEQFGPAHDRGSSHGETRIIRKAYFEHPDYVPLLHAAYDGWRELAQATGRRLYDPIGLVLAGAPEGEAVAGTRQAAARHELPLDVLTAAEAQQQFPEFRFHERDTVLFERDAGRLHVEACVQAHLDRAGELGAELRFHEPVMNWSVDDRGVRVFTERAGYAAGQLIITAGPWAGRVLADRGIPLRVLRKVQLWFAGTPAADTPAFYFEEPDGAFYGIPSPGGAAIKIAEHTGGEDVEAAALVDRRLTAADVARVETFLRRRLPDIPPLPVRHSVCLYTMSPDGHFLVDRHPHHDQVAFAAGLSGHGFKFTGVLGRILADLATTGRTGLPAEFLAIARRFATTGPALR